MNSCICSKALLIDFLPFVKLNVPLLLPLPVISLRMLEQPSLKDSQEKMLGKCATGAACKWSKGSSFTQIHSALSKNRHLPFLLLMLVIDAHLVKAKRDGRLPLQKWKSFFFFPSTQAKIAVGIIQQERHWPGY